MKYLSRIKNVFIEKDLEVTLKYLKVNSKRFWMSRLLLGVGFFFFFMLLFMKTKNSWFVVCAPATAYIAYKMFYLKISSMKNRTAIINSFLFPHFLRTFISLLGTQGNIYQTLVACIPYLEDPLKSEVERLLQKIKKENIQENNRKHFMDFADFIDSNEAYLIMSMIYEFTVVGVSKDMLAELERYIDDIQKNKTSELKEYKTLKIQRHANLPLLAAIAFVFIFTGSIMFFYFSQMGSQM